LALDTACDAGVDVGMDDPKRNVWPLANVKRVDSLIDSLAACQPTFLLPKKKKLTMASISVLRLCFYVITSSWKRKYNEAHQDLQ
jgi:hypothetical protein